MAEMDELLTRLKSEASIETSEGFDDELDLQPDIEESIIQHNRLYTVASLPNEEVQLVMLLAWAKVCYRRAAKFAKEPNVTGGQGFGTDRSTPYTKNIALAKALLDRYASLVDNMGLEGSATNVVLSRLRAFDPLTNQVVPRRLGTPPGVKLSVIPGDEDQNSLTEGTILDIHWETRDCNNFTNFFVFVTTDGSTIYEPTNYDSGTGVPRIADGATKVADITRFAVRDMRLTDVDKDQENHVLVVIKTASDQYSYSNELIFGGA